MKLSIKQSMLYTFLLVALIPIILISAINWYIITVDEEHDRENLIENSMQFIKKHYQRDKNYLQTILNNINIIFSEAHIDDVDPTSPPFKHLLESVEMNAYLDILMVINKEGKIVVADNSKLIGQKIIIPEKYRDVFLGKEIVSTEVLDPDLINVISSESENVPDVLKFIRDGDPETIKNLTTDKDIYLTGVVPLQNPDSKEIQGAIVGCVRLSHNTFKFPAKFKLAEFLKIQMIPAYDKPEEQKFMNLQPLYNFNNKPVAYIVITAKPGIFKVVLNQTETYGLYVSIFMALLAIIASIFFSKHLTNPIIKLDEATDEVKQGNYDLDLNIEGPEELVHLGNAFKEMGQDLQEKKKMQENYIATLTHDMRVPLLAEQKALDLLYNDERFGVSTDQKVILENMVSSNKDLIILVNTLLDSYKLEAGKYRIDIEDNDIVSVTNDCINELKPLTDEKQQSIKFKNQGQSLTIGFDKPELKRVIRNLLSNAIKFTNKNGKVDIQITQDNDKITVSISDNGKGMTEKELSQLFQRYSSTAKKLRKVGTGLGLFLSYQIIKAHEGDMWAESQPEEGSTFYFTLPRKKTN